MNLENEIIWAPIEGFPNYEVSNSGLVRSIRLGKNIVLKPFINEGRAAVCLSHNGKLHCRAVSQLVAQAFVPNPYNYMRVNHLSGDISDNRSVNLEFIQWLQKPANSELVHKPKTTKYRGVSIDRKGTISASTSYNGKFIKKVFKTVEDAARQYDAWCVEKGRPKINFPEN